MVVKIKTDYERVKASIIQGLSKIEIPILKSYYRGPNYCVDIYIKSRDNYGPLLIYLNDIAYRTAHHSVNMEISRRFTPILDKRYGSNFVRLQFFKKNTFPWSDK